MYVECRKNFLGVRFGFSVCFWGFVLFLYGVLGSVFAVLACACMLFSVAFHVVMREVRMLHRALRRKRFRKKKEMIA